MSQQRYSEKYCDLKKITVTVLDEAASELGRDGIMEWKIRKCLSKDNVCGDLDCKYIHKSIGDSRTKDPFRR